MRQELLHPLVVHLPIAIVFLWLVFELFGTIFEKRVKDVDQLLVVFATIGTTFAYLAGLTGEMAFSQISSEATKELVASHAKLGSIVVWLYVTLLTTASLVLALPVKWLRTLRFSLAFGVAILVGMTAFRGCKLVFTHGIGVERQIETAAPAKQP